MNITVVTPSYNMVKYLPALLKNIESIKGINIEHIVVDGNSTDGTQDLLEKFTHRYNLRWISEEDDGQYDAINKGFKMASNDIVGYQNADDLYFPKGLIQLVKVLESSLVVGGFGKYVICNPSGSFQSTPCNVGRFSFSRLKRGNYIFPGSCFVRKSCIGNIAFDTKLKFYGDWDWLLQIAATQQQFTYVQDVISMFRHHVSAKTSTFSYDQLHAEQAYISKKHGLNLSLIELNEVVTPFRQILITQFKKLAGVHTREASEHNKVLSDYACSDSI